MLRHALYALYIVVVAVMATATIAEKYRGTAFTAEAIYGSWWFSLLWALLAAVAVVWMVRRRMRRWHLIVLHASFLVILAGALLTHLTAWRGNIHLRTGEASAHYTTLDGREGVLPFLLRLDRFSVVYHEGTDAAADYVSELTIEDGSSQRKARVSMNNICSHRDIRFYQSAFDADMRGTTLAINADPWGIPVTYTGYALLFVALLWMLVSPRGTFRRLLASPLLRRGAMSLLLFAVTAPGTAAAPLPPTLPDSVAAEFSRVSMLYLDRVCPVETYALDFTKKLCGKRSWRGLTATQVLAGFAFYPSEWGAEPLLKVKGGELRKYLGLEGRASVNDFFHPERGYLLGPLLQEYQQGNRDDLHKQATQMDDRLMLIMKVRQGRSLKLFPHTTAADDAAATAAAATTWYAATDRLPKSLSEEHARYIGNLFNWMQDDLTGGHPERVGEGMRRLAAYQRQFGGSSVPSESRLSAEHAYNAVAWATLLFMVCLTAGFLSLALIVVHMQRPSRSTRRLLWLFTAVLAAAFAALTACLALRWAVSGTVPMTNGYETMLFLAWMVMLITLLFSRHFPLLLTFGLLTSGFFLLVSHISQMDPQIGRVMPVLNSPLLSLHVSVIMTSYALLSLTFLLSLAALAASVRRGHSLRRALFVARCTLLSRLFLFPAIATMGVGIFVGAIWANISWGTYWSWDPKETWALITFMVYSVALHRQSVPQMQRPLAFNLFMVLSFATMLMTYFGVNYLLGGMHSYA